MSFGRWCPRSPSCKDTERSTIAGNYVRAGEQSCRIKLPESFPSDPLSSRSGNESRAATLFLLAKPSRLPLASRSRLLLPSRSSSLASSWSLLLCLHLSSFLQAKANIPADNTEDPIVRAERAALYIGLAGEMKYAAKRHVQSVRQVVRQIKHDSHPDGSVGKQLMNMKSRGSNYCQAPCNNSSFKGKCM